MTQEVARFPHDTKCDLVANAITRSCLRHTRHSVGEDLFGIDADNDAVLIQRIARISACMANFVIHEVGHATIMCDT